jgi:chemotaxis signal transduction protein
VIGVQAVLLPVGAELYAVPMDWVRVVVAAPPVTRLPTSPPLVLGLFNLRGQIVPLFDTAALLGVGAVGAVKFAAVIQTPDGLVGLAATGLPQRAVLEAPTGPSELPGTNGVYQLTRRVAVLLDPAALLTPERLGGRDVRAVALPTGVG